MRQWLRPGADCCCLRRASYPRPLAGGQPGPPARSAGSITTGAKACQRSLAAVHKESEKPQEELTIRAGCERLGRRGGSRGEAKLRQPPGEIICGGFRHPAQKL